MLQVAATGIVAGALVWVLASVLLGADADELGAGLVPALCGALATAAVLLLGAQREREAQRREIEAANERAREAREAQERERRDGDERVDRERRARALVERARQAERAWAQELRGQVLALHHARGALSRTDDTRALVLQVALSVLGAEKGLLLSHDLDGDGHDDGPLRLICAEGFEHDPSDSAIAKTFAEKVIARDVTVRENDSRELAREGRAEADDEIDNLVAIPIYLRDDFAGVVVCANRDGGFDEYDDEVLLALGDHAGAVLHNERLRGELRTSYVATVAMLADAIAAKDPFVGGHSEEVSSYVATDVLDFTIGDYDQRPIGGRAGEKRRGQQ